MQAHRRTEFLSCCYNWKLLCIRPCSFIYGFRLINSLICGQPNCRRICKASKVKHKFDKQFAVFCLTLKSNIAIVVHNCIPVSKKSLKYFDLIDICTWLTAVSICLFFYLKCLNWKLNWNFLSIFSVFWCTQKNLIDVKSAVLDWRIYRRIYIRKLYVELKFILKVTHLSPGAFWTVWSKKRSKKKIMIKVVFWQNNVLQVLKKCNLLAQEVGMFAPAQVTLPNSSLHIRALQ